jgi:hypothetical protein
MLRNSAEETRFALSKFPEIFAESGQAGVAGALIRDHSTEYHSLLLSPMALDQARSIDQKCGR